MGAQSKDLSFVLGNAGRGIEFLQEGNWRGCAEFQGPGCFRVKCSLFLFQSTSTPLGIRLQFSPEKEASEFRLSVRGPGPNVTLV